MKKIFLFMLIFLIPFVVNAYEVKKVWENDNISYRRLIYEDGEIVSFDGDYINKHDKDGKIVWENSWGGNGYEWFESGILTNDGGFILVGSFKSTDVPGLPNKGESDGMIVKFNKDGNVLWQKNWGGSARDEFYSIASTEDGGFVVGGNSASTDIEGITSNGELEGLIVKYDKDGNVLWQKKQSDSASEVNCFNHIFSTDSGDIFAADDYYKPAIIVKYDKDGNMLWEKKLGADLGAEGYGGQVYLLNDGEIILFSNTAYKMVKYDKDGNMLWKKDWPEDDYYSKFVLENGDIIGVTDNYDRVSMQTDAMITKFDIQGNIKWEKVFDIGEFYDVYSVLFTADGELIVYGSIPSSDYWIYNDKTVKYSIKYDLENKTSENGTSTVEQKGKYGIITATPSEGYEVDKIIVKDTAGNEIETTKLDDGTYTFELYDDVTIDVSFARAFRIDVKDYFNGNANIVKSDDNVVVITPTPDKGYELDKIVVKNSKNEIVEVTKLEDGTYTFALSDDISVEVTFKEKIENPKTGILDVITILIVGIMISITGFFLVKKYNERYEM